MGSKNDIVGLDKTIRELKNIPRGTLNELRKELRTAIKPEIKGIRSFIRGAENRLRAAGGSGNPANVFNEGRTGWSGANVALEFRPGRSKGYVLTIRATGKKKQFGYDYAELAGKLGGSTPQGRAYIDMLERRFKWSGAGRFAYRAVINQIDTIYYKTAKIIFRYVGKVSTKLESSLKQAGAIR